MKKVLFSMIMAMVMIITVSAKEIVAKGKTYTAMGSYEITICDLPCIIDGKELKTFAINYKNSPVEVKIAIERNKKETVYIVTSDKVSVKYVQGRRHFGIGEIIDGKNMDMEEYYHQKVLTKRQSEKESMMLIAAYYPYLLKG